MVVPVDPVQITSPLRAARNRNTSPSAEASLLSGKSNGCKSCLCTVLAFLGRTSFCPAHCGTSNLSQTKESAIRRTRRLYFKWLADWQLQKRSLSNLAGNVNHTSKFLPHSIIGVDVKNCVSIYDYCIYNIKSYLHPYDIPSLQASQRYSIWLWIMYSIHLVESLFDAMVRYSLQAHFSCNACSRSYTAWTCREHQHDCGKRGAKRPMSDHVTWCLFTSILLDYIYPP